MYATNSSNTSKRSPLIVISTIDESPPMLGTRGRTTLAPPLRSAMLSRRFRAEFDSRPDAMPAARHLSSLLLDDVRAAVILLAIAEAGAVKGAVSGAVGETVVVTVAADGGDEAAATVAPLVVVVVVVVICKSPALVLLVVAAVAASWMADFIGGDESIDVLEMGS